VASNIIDLENLDPQRKAWLKELTKAPKLALPTAIMCVVLVVTYTAVYITGFAGLLPLWVGLVINSVVGYLAFSVAHDAIHRSISSDPKLNDRIGQLGIAIVLPYINIKLFRWAHILHHRFANGERDPDKYFNGPLWSLPFRWMLIEIAYLIYAMKNADKISRPGLHSSLRRALVFFVFLGALVYAGYGYEVLMLWLIPTRIVELMLGLTFFWLPHVPHDVTQEENYTRATTVRKGYEFLLNPLMQYQNYHLIHHLFPMTPFYNNKKVYDLIEPELGQYEMAIQHGFAIRPEIVPGRVATR
jgi:beta-carotene hydroxylase